MSRQIRVELINSGEELLLGLTANGHLGFVGAELARRGVKLRRNVVVDDGLEGLCAQFVECWSRADLVITTGGLGPTGDDRTRDAVAEALGRELVLDPEIEAAIADRFRRMGRAMTPNNSRQAMKPKGAVALPNPHGTAPGLWIEEGGKVVALLPGPPQELYPMFFNEVLPRLVERGLLRDEEAYVQLRTAGVGESLLETRLHPVLSAYPEIEVAFCAHEGQVDCRLSPRTGPFDRAVLERAAAQCASVLGEDWVGYGHESLADRVCAMLAGCGRTLAVAESCTGGLLSNTFTDVPGASRVFAGAVVCYSNDAKIQMLDVPECLLKQHGPVSAETALALVTGAAERFSSDYALSITGFAGPEGGTPDDPVGTVYLGLYAPDGVWTQRLFIPASRATVKRRAVNGAIDWLRRKLLRES